VAEVIKNKAGCDISYALHYLRPQLGINDDIINQYLNLIQEMAPKNVLIASHTLLARPRNSDFDRKDGIHLLQLIIPVHHPHSDLFKQHWTLAILKRAHQAERFSLELYDSLCQHEAQIPNSLRVWLADLDLSETSTAKPNPQQNLFSQDCGLYLLLCARLAANGVPIPSQFEIRHLMRSFRRRALAELLAGKLDPTMSDFEEFQANEEQRRIEACALTNTDHKLRKPLEIVLEGDREVVNLISPATTTYCGDLESDNHVLWKPSLTIDPKVISYRNEDYSGSELESGASDEENTPKSQSLFVTSIESDRETVRSSEGSPIGSVPGLPTPAPSRSGSPSIESRSSSHAICTPSECNTSSSAASPQSSSSSSHVSSQGSNPCSTSSDGNTTISRRSLPKQAISSKCTKASSDKDTQTCRKSLYLAHSECSQPDNASSERRSETPCSVPYLERSSKKLPHGAQRMTSPLALGDLKTLPSILESSHVNEGKGAIIISLPEENSHSEVDIDISLPTMVQSLTFHEEAITNNFEKMEKRTKITLQSKPRMDLDAAGLEELVLLFENHVQQGKLNHLDYVTDILVTTQESRGQLSLPSSKITNPVGNALKYTSARFDGIHTPMAYLSGEYGKAFSSP